MPEEVRIEAELYEPTRLFLHAAFGSRLAETTTTSVQIFSADTSRAQVADGGQWSRPDVAALVLGAGAYVPYWKTDLHTFEVKTAGGLSETAVHEANAHGRYGHYAWLVFQSVGRASIEAEGTFRRVQKLAAHLGVGVVHFQNPREVLNWTVELWPRRTGTDNATADAFVRERFPEETKTRIESRLRALGWRGCT